MAYISYNKLWESEFNGIVSKRNELQDLNINEIKLEVHDTHKKCEIITTNFKTVDHEDVINKSFSDEKVLKKTVTYQNLKKNTTSSKYKTTNNL